MQGSAKLCCQRLLFWGFIREDGGGFTLCGEAFSLINQGGGNRASPPPICTLLPDQQFRGAENQLGWFPCDFNVV